LAKPPPDVPPDELWLKLSEPAPFEVFDFPRKGPDGKPLGRVRIHVLRQEDHIAAKVSAHAAIQKDAARRDIEKLTRDDLESPGLQSAIADQIAVELLATALHSTKPMAGSEHSERPSYPRLFYGSEDIRKKLSADEIAVLFSAYLMTQAKYGPFEANLEREDVEAWVRRLEEGGSSFPLVHLPWPQLAELAFLLAGRIYSLSRILASRRESLPSTLVSELEPYCMATCFSGEPPAASTSTSWESSAEALAAAVRVAEKNRPDLND
jgi:hypothetical protein